jgi:hypothetical protein
MRANGLTWAGLAEMGSFFRMADGVEAARQMGSSGEVDQPDWVCFVNFAVARRCARYLTDGGQDKL